MRRKLLLIHPINKIRKGFTNDQSTSFMPLGLGIVAALTPQNWDVELIDESYEEFQFTPADLVAFTGFTASAPRAYEMAAIYRQAGIHTVMGGIHATMYTDEVAKYVDTVVTGEAEGAWPALIADFESGKIRNRYDGGLVGINEISPARRDIYQKYPYAYDLVQTSRGCPIGCEFCSVTQMCGQTYRERDVDSILEELEKTYIPLVFFVDDNFVNNKKGAAERAIRLFKGMIDRKIKKYWMCQAAINFADNEEVLYWARKSGCVMVMVGVEAENANALKDVRKNLNLKRGVNSYEKVFKKAHKHGIGILAFMIFGMESDKKEDLYARRDFILNSSIDTYQCAILTPLPGTVLYDRMKDQERIIFTDYPSDWQQYDCQIASINTPNLNHNEVDIIMHDIWMSLYNKETIRRKMFRTLWNTKSFLTAYWTYASIHNFGRIFLGKIYNTNPNGKKAGVKFNPHKRTLFLRFTDIVIWLFYRVSWQKVTRRFEGK